MKYKFSTIQTEGDYTVIVKTTLIMQYLFLNVGMVREHMSAFEVEDHKVDHHPKVERGHFLYVVLQHEVHKIVNMETKVPMQIIHSHRHLPFQL
jgi:hypothetical protein